MSHPEYFFLVALCALFARGSPKLLLETGDVTVKSASELKQSKDSALMTKSTLTDPKELLDESANEQVLELIVKIAEQPATWRQIHRVLETLEANNAAYSQRVDAANRNNDANWLFKRTDRPGDKRNDVPDDQPVNSGTSTITTEASFLNIESEFQRWREALFASSAIEANEDILAHPQYYASPSDSMTATDRPLEHSTTTYLAWSLPDAQQQADDLRLEKKFEVRLSEIEDELRRLTKLSQMIPLQVKRMKPNVNADQPLLLRDKAERTNKTNTTDFGKKDASDHEAKRNSFRAAHPKFHYHRVESRNSGEVSLDRLVGSEFWNRVASLKENYTLPSTPAKRNAIVAVSLGPLTSTVRRKDDVLNSSSNQDNLMQATEPLHPTSIPAKLCKKKCHLGVKQKPRQRKSRLENAGAKVDKSQKVQLSQ